MQSKEVSRRNFVGGAMAAAALTAFGLVGCSSETDASANAQSDDITWESVEQFGDHQSGIG